MHTYDKPTHECGVIGVYNRDGAHAVRTAYYGLFALQHRGQASCGIAVNDDGTIVYHKDSGLLTEVFNDTLLTQLEGSIAVGHVRYATRGDIHRENAQPLVTKYKKGNLTIAMNGTLINGDELRKAFMNDGAIFQTTSDIEVIAYVIAKERIHSHAIEEAVARAMDILQGSYSLIVMSPRKLIAARDPNGIRPLCMGSSEHTVVFASESCALDAVDVRFERDIDPGEVVVIDVNGLRTDRRHCTGKGKLCIFEHIYFARPDSVIDGVSVYEARVRAGHMLAAAHPVEADLVIPVPDSGIDCAIGYAQASGIPYGVGLIRNRYVGRTFIQPTQKERERAVKTKLNALSAAIKGKRIVIVDDSIVRGTTLHHTMQTLRDAGATELHLRISCPPFIYPCHFGTDIPSQEHLIACRHTIAEMTEIFGVDTLGFLPIGDLPSIMNNGAGYCDECFSGNRTIK